MHFGESAKKHDKFSNNHKRGGGGNLSAAVPIHKASGSHDKFQFTSVHFQFVKIDFPAGAVVSIHKCQLADQQVSIGSQVAVNDRIASFQCWSGAKWSGVEWIGLDCK
jgi:hypothetical protein